MSENIAFDTNHWAGYGAGVLIQFEFPSRGKNGFPRPQLPENARAVHANRIQLQEAQGLHDKTIKAKLRHILRFAMFLDRTRSSDLTPEIIQSHKRTLALSDDTAGAPKNDEEAISRLSATTIVVHELGDLKAFAPLTGVRDGALITFRLKHARLARREVFRDARAVHTKGSKTMPIYWFPAGEDIEAIVPIHFRQLRLA